MLLRMQVYMCATAGKDKTLFLNQACASTWLTRITLSTNVGMHIYVCVCPPPRLLITSGVMRCDIDPI